MEFSPTDFKADNSLSSKKRRGGKETSSLTGQTLEVGSLGAVTLALKDNRLEWKTLVQLEANAQPRRNGEPIQMLPPSRPFQPTLHEMSVQQKAAEEIKFLRTNYPDVDVPFDLLQEEIHADKKELKEFDPYQGNQIAQLTFLDKNQCSLDFICTPFGETGSELNVFPIRAMSSASTFNLITSSIPLMKFDTPIRQLEAFSRLNIVKNHSLLAVRTYGSTAILKIVTNRRNSSDHPLDAEVLRSFSSAETNNCQVVDVSCRCLSHTSGQMLLVNDTGNVFLSDIISQLRFITSPGIDPEEAPDKFWRVAWTGVNTFIRTSARKAHSFDSRAPETTLLHLADFKECITSVETTSAQSLSLGFSTTSRLLLFDVRHLGRPVVSLYHHRSFDRTLKLKSFSMDDTMWHTLSSSRNRLVTTYNTSSLADPIHLQGMPSIFPSSVEVDLPIVGSHIFQGYSSPPGSPISYLQLSSTGSLWSTDVIFAERDLEERRFLSPMYNEAMEELVERSKARSSQLEENELESTEADLSDVYRKLTRVKKEEEHRESFYQVLDKLPSFWQDTDSPIDDMLTTFDIAFRSGQEPSTSLRADFLTGSALNSRRGLAALLHDRLPTPQLSQTAPWSFDLASLPPELVPDAAAPPRQLLDRLTEEAVARETTDNGIKFALEAAQELVTDLTLSRHVYAPRKFSNMHREPSADDNLLTATQALSLDPPTIPPSEFAYLQPIAADQKLKEGEDKPDEPFELLPGVRLLLSEWKVGAKPEDYVFQDWCRSTSQDLPGTELDRSKVTDQRFEPSQPRSPQIPPVVMHQPPPIASVPKIQAKRGSPFIPSRSLFPIREGGGSQMDFHMTQESVFQEQYPNTQPLSGPFGGQLNLNKKKSVKKRIGGF